MIDALPVELLSSIFFICVHGHCTPPEHLSWVSKRWRRVAIGFAQLWTDVYYGAKEDIPRMSVFLERSGTTPFDVELRVKRYLQTPCPRRAWPQYSRLIFIGLGRFIWLNMMGGKVSSLRILPRRLIV